MDIEDLIYSAYEHGRRTALLNEVSKLRCKDNYLYCKIRYCSGTRMELQR